MRRFLITALIVAVFGGGPYGGYRIYRQRIAAQTSDCQTAAFQYGDFTVEVGAPGTLRASQTAQVIWQATGQVDQVAVTSDQKASVDQKLASLSADSLLQSLIMAQADLVCTQKNVESVTRAGATNLQGSVTFNTIVRVMDPDDQVLSGMATAVNIVTHQENLFCSRRTARPGRLPENGTCTF